MSCLFEPAASPRAARVSCTAHACRGACREDSVLTATNVDVRRRRAFLLVVETTFQLRAMPHVARTVSSGSMHLSQRGDRKQSYSVVPRLASSKT